MCCCSIWKMFVFVSTRVSLLFFFSSLFFFFSFFLFFSFLFFLFFLSFFLSFFFFFVVVAVVSILLQLLVYQHLISSVHIHNVSLSLYCSSAAQYAETMLVWVGQFNHVAGCISNRLVRFSCRRSVTGGIWVTDTCISSSPPPPPSSRAPPPPPPPLSLSLPPPPFDCSTICTFSFEVLLQTNQYESIKMKTK